VEYDGSMTDRRGGRAQGRGPSTRAVHGATDAPGGAMSTPIQHSSTFAFPSLEAMDAAQALGPAGAYYQRLGHPTLRACEERLAALEEAEMALLFPSGMAAISAAFLAHVKAGDHIVALAQTYGGTRVMLEWGAARLGWSFDLVDAREPGSWERAFRANTRIFHVESPTNPVLCVVDLAAAAQLAHRHGALLAVDNTVASPLYQSERWNQGAFQYQFAVSNGTHTVILKFAEIYFTLVGQRVFNVVINGQTVLSSFDIVASAGGRFVAIDRQFTVNVTNGLITIQLIPVAQNPKINAIEID